MVRAGLIAAAALLALLGAMVAKDRLALPPEVRAATAQGTFDAHRAAARLARILGDQRAHPVDSDADDLVRERLIAEMRSVGLSPRVTDDFACNGDARVRAVTCARVRNVVATIGSPDPSAADPGGSSRPGHDHLLLSAHYDSTFAGPGAADAGIGMATLLEVAALMRGREIRRPVTFLFNEGEEMGLIGARAFLQSDPLAPRVGALLNFEARGVEGPATMFETSRPNAPALARFARAADRTIANSLTTDLYRLIPNSTDVAVFEEADWTILNFAIIGNETRYHSAGDELPALDRRSLQHMGDQALALTLDFARHEAPEAAGERLYMDLMGRQLVTLPLVFGLALLGLLVVYFAIESWRRRALGRPLASVVVASAGAAALAFAGQAVLGLIRAGDYWRGYPWVTELAVYASAMAACLLTLHFVAGGAERTRMRVAFWFAFLLAGTALAIVAPGGSVFFLLPPLAMGLGMALAPAHRYAERIGAIAAALLLFLSFAPALALLEELMNGGPHWLFAPLGAAMLMPAMIELRPMIARIPRAFVLAGAGDLLLLPWAAVALTPAYSTDRQQLFTIDHVWDADARAGRWAVNNDGRPVPFEADWVRTRLPHSMRERWAAPAPAIPVTPPAVVKVGEAPVPGGRRVRVRIAANGAATVTLVAPPEAPLRAGGSTGYLREFGPGGDEDSYFLRCVGRSCDGATLDLVVRGRAPVELIVVGSRPGLPAQAAPLVRARPALARPQYSPDSTIAYRRMRI